MPSVSPTRVQLTWKPSDDGIPAGNKVSQEQQRKLVARVRAAREAVAKRIQERGDTSTSERGLQWVHVPRKDRAQKRTLSPDYRPQTPSVTPPPESLCATPHSSPSNFSTAHSSPNPKIPEVFNKRCRFDGYRAGPAMLPPGQTPSPLQLDDPHTPDISGCRKGLDAINFQTPEQQRYVRPSSPPPILKKVGGRQAINVILAPHQSE